MNKIWKVRGDNITYTDEELIKMIKDGSLNANDYIATKEMKKWIQIKESIYQYYIEGEIKDETL